MTSMKSRMIRVVLTVLLGFAGLCLGADGIWTGAGENDYLDNTNNWVNNVVAGNWNNTTFNASTVKGRILYNVFQGNAVWTLASGLTNNIYVRNGNFYMNTANSSAITIASDSSDLTFLGMPLWCQGGVLPFTIGSGRRLAFNSMFYWDAPATSGIEKKGAGVFMLVYTNAAIPWTLSIREGTVQTTVDRALNTVKASVSTGATLNVGATVQTLSSLTGGGVVSGADGDLMHAGVDGSLLISTNKNYLYKLAFAKTEPLTVNGVVFSAATTSGDGFSLSGGFATHAGDPARTPSYATGAYSNLLLRFYHGSLTPALTFSNLTVGKRYEAVIFCNQGWNWRPQDVNCISGTSTNRWRGFNSSTFGYLACRFTANGTSATIAMDSHDANTFMWFGATLEDLTGVEPSSRGGTVVVANSEDCTFAGTITGNVALVKSGSGALTLGGTNTYSGTTVISNGTLKGVFKVPIVNSGYEYPGLGNIGWPYGALMNDTNYFPGGPNDGLSGGWYTTTPTATGFARPGIWFPGVAPEGSQASFLRPAGTLHQVVSAPVPGLYTLTFKAAGRPNYGSSSLAVMIDGSTQTNWPATAFSSTWWTNCAASLNLSAGTHVLTFTNTLNDWNPNICIDDVALTVPMARLPTNAVLSLAGGVLDLTSVTQTVASVSSGAGVVSNGTLRVTSALYPGGTGVTGTLNCANLVVSEGASLYWDYKADGADKVKASGTVTLPANATVRVSASETLPPRATLFECGSVNAPSGVSGWTVVGGKGNSRVVLNGNLVQLVSPRGTMISIF